jgi:uncharacterized protein
MKFLGREKELQRLEELKGQSGARLAVITGRRRIGKSRLVQEFARQFARFLEFSGLPPEPGLGPAEQREEFIRQLSDQCALPRFASDDWGELFRVLSRESVNGPVLILLDEISWMASKDKLFLAKLKTAWDLYFSRNPQLILVLCGSVSSWIEDNILSSTAFVGRISLRLVLKELSLPNCSRFWQEQQDRVSAYEKFKVLAVTGGVPRYLEEIKPQETAEQNISRLCFREGALLFDEFDSIFSDLFNRKAPGYKQILRVLAKGSKTYREIAAHLKRARGGSLSNQLDDLISTGFVQKNQAWSLADGSALKLAQYRLSDNYSRFYLKYIEPHKDKIRHGAYPDRAMSYLPAWEAVMGLQFENLVVSNVQRVVNALGLVPADVTNLGPYFQTGTRRRPGVQVDILIQDRYGTLFICEIKFTRGELGNEVIKDVSHKMELIKTPRHTSKRAVLIYAGNVSEAVLESRFFSSVIPFERFLTE